MVVMEKRKLLIVDEGGILKKAELSARKLCELTVKQ
jgi:hypothetical protein